jgi:hypothetical protein
MKAEEEAFLAVSLSAWPASSTVLPTPLAAACLCPQGDSTPSQFLEAWSLAGYLPEKMSKKGNACRGRRCGTSG